MADPQELAICRRRGHDPIAKDRYWVRCKWCGMWLREKRIIEEREDEPPDDEKDPIHLLQRDLNRQLKRKTRPEDKPPEGGGNISRDS